ncbi:DnaJ domain containing protein [Plasmodium gonderi]|uniref:DnaJ domain containing protein n=1 Tax=Plasmodium gonderi TaxID=77519 RepID=A0A1Y1JKG4_PLAGO|nr:DnaJ domain containing protein [Plasmodium gonderi]GAW82999.1 DnaJ domain containing protein [Plasmodium gonderi]
MDPSFIPKELAGKDIYKILGLSYNDADKENIKNVIRKRYLKYALILHPDKNEGVEKSEKIETSADSFNTLKCAYEFLMNENLRKKYNHYVAEEKAKEENKKVKNVRPSNISLSRFLDEKIFDAHKNEKLAYKRKLEEQEKKAARERKCYASRNTSETWQSSMKHSPSSTFNYRACGKRKKKKKKNADEEIGEEADGDEEAEGDEEDMDEIQAKGRGEYLKKIKRENEEFMRKYSAEPCGKKKGHEKLNDDKTIEIYLNNYLCNVNLLQEYIKEKHFINFFINFNFLKYELNMNDKEKNNERKVGYFIFSHRSEAISAYLYYKKNANKIYHNFKLKLVLPCNDNKKVGRDQMSEQHKGEEEDKNNSDKIMNEMVNELDKMFFSV